MIASGMERGRVDTLISDNEDIRWKQFPIELALEVYLIRWIVEGIQKLRKGVCMNVIVVHNQISLQFVKGMIKIVFTY